MSTKESSLYPSIVSSFRKDISLLDIDRLSQSEQDLHFAMRCNGFFRARSGQWIFDPNTTKPLTREFMGTRVAFFGPNAREEASGILSGSKLDQSWFIRAFYQQEFISVIRKYRQIDEDLTARIAFLFGGVIRYMLLEEFTAHKGVTKAAERTIKIADSVKFASRMAMLGEARSAEAIATALAMYIISRGSLEEDKKFEGYIYNMAEAVSKDPIVPLETRDLGLSQVRRLRTFIDTSLDEQDRPFPDISLHQMAFEGFPTVGAEFHFNPDEAKEYPNFWQRLAILNMSQYQRGSYIQLSRDDRGVIEVRMNPSIYPVTIANWRHIRRLLPELNQAFFIITLNRPTENFDWRNEKDKDLLNKIRALELLSYTGIFENIPRMEKPQEIDFGTIYLGQTVKINNGKYELSGDWGYGEGLYGQLSIYAGFGDNFPHLAYYPSMAIAKPDILGVAYNGFWSFIKNLDDALAIRPADRRYVFRALQDCIKTDGRLNKARESGNSILELLNPY